MALTIKQLLNYSWMSQVSYLDFAGLSNGASEGAFINKLLSPRRAHSLAVRHMNNVS